MWENIHLILPTDVFPMSVYYKSTSSGVRLVREYNVYVCLDHISRK